MLFNSLSFLVFFILVLAAFLLIRNWSGRKWLLLVASYVFYAAWHPPYVLILLASTVLDWQLARSIGKASSARVRRLLLQTSLVANLGVLGTFKYADFLLQNFSHLLAAAGIHYAPPELGWVLPVGISFYTFASLSYTIDVYRREISSDTSFVDYALFVSFFPHLVAGPIVRASYLLPQIAAPRLPTRQQMGWGLVLLVFGLFCKSVLADNMFAPVVDEIYADPSRYMAGDVWLGVLAFSGQIFYDFSGYSLCAIGIALCFGFAFPDNFRFPYAAAGFSDFWRRWHISLSTWLRDYLYVPLGGNRHGEWRTYVNLFLTMLIGGLWHGASWMFVMWGGLHGVYLAVERWWRGHGSGYDRVSDTLPYVLFTFLVVTLTWIPFRASSMDAVGAVFSGLVHAGGSGGLESSARLLCGIGILATLAGQFVLRHGSLEEAFGKLGSGRQILLVTAALIAIFLFSGGDERDFIYFQF